MGRSKNTSFDLLQLVIFHYEKGCSYRKIASMLKLSKSTVGDIILRYKNEDRLEPIKQTGRPKLLTERDNRLIMRKVKEDPKISAPKLQIYLEQYAKKKVSLQTIRRCIHNHGFFGRIARKKPWVSNKNRKMRLDFASNYILKEEDYWSDVIFCDESKFNLFGSDGRPRVWRKVNEALKCENLRPTVKHGGGSVMVWGCISSEGVGKLVFIEGIMNKTYYLNLLKENLRSSAKDMGILHTFKFYQDNDPKHTAKIVQEWMLYNCPKIIKTPAQSPDLNAIENVWHFLETQIRKHEITNKDSLKRALKEEWSKIDIVYKKISFFNA